MKVLILFIVLTMGISLISVQEPFSIDLEVGQGTSAGQPMRLNVKIKNTSGKSQVIDKNSVWYMLTFQRGAGWKTIAEDSAEDRMAVTSFFYLERHIDPPIRLV